LYFKEINMKPYGDTKPMEDNYYWTCTVCPWDTETDFGEHSLSELINDGCPKCSSKLFRLRVYVCPFCGEHCGGTSYFNWHVMYRHWYQYDLLGSDPRFDKPAKFMRKYFPELWHSHVKYVQTHFGKLLEGEHNE
jgi:hypothetical protein